jgi:Sulfotransferase domain
MIYGLKVVVKYMLGLDYAARNFKVFPDDTMIVSYPRSGNTWTRFLIANLVHPNENVTFANIETLIPDTSAISNRALKAIPRPRLIKSHEYFDHRYPRVIYIVRDPRDVALSYYDFDRKYRHIPDGYSLEKYIDEFVEGKLMSSDWGTWGENVSTWTAARANKEEFLLLRYEDMLQDTSGELSRVADFLRIPTTPNKIDQAIAASSADRMRELEKQQEHQWVATKKHRKDIPFVRTARSGGWKENLPETCVIKIESAWGDLMSCLGYPLVSTRIPEDQAVTPASVS